MSTTNSSSQLVRYLVIVVVMAMVTVGLRAVGMGLEMMYLEDAPVSREALAHRP